MEKFLKRKSTLELSPPPKRNDDCSNQSRVEINLVDFPADPGLRTRILDYNLDDRDQIRRAYLQKGPCQPRNYTFPQKKFGQALRRFNPSWFSEYANWLEYSIVKDAAFCLCCYLFKPDIGEQAGGDSFVGEGFSNWKKKEKFRIHVGGPNSAHNQAWNKCQELMNQKQNIKTIFSKESDQARSEYQICLNASIDCIRYLLRQGLAFCGHNEFEDSSNEGNFLELLRFLANHNEDIKIVALKNEPENLKLMAPDIQKDIVSVIADETINTIVRDIGDALFSILIDVSCDLSTKEQMAVVLRYVDKKGHVIERFLGIEHITDTAALSLEAAIEELFSRHGLSMSRLRGQGYEGDNNMQDEFNDLKTLIMKENECAFYVHNFAHQLQSTLVAVAKNHIQIALFFNLVANVVNVVGASCKHCDIPQEKQATIVIEALKNGELPSGQGLNRETSLKRSSDTHGGSHYSTLINLISMFSSVIDVLDIIVEDGLNSEQRGEARVLLDSMQSFDFVFNLHLMRTILGITNELSQALQRKDQDIVIAMTLVKVSTQRLQMMRESGWDSLLEQVSSFCGKNNIVVPNMGDMFLARERPRHRAQDITNLQHYCVELFYVVIDMQLQELNSRFTKANTELLLCVACLSPNDSFSAFDKQKLIRLAQFYPKEFSEIELMALEDQLETYILDMRSSIMFSGVKEIGGLAQKMVETKKDIIYESVYLLMTLALILPVATATVERAFSALKIVKNRLRNGMGDQWMNDNLVVYIEKDIFNGIDNEVIMQRFRDVKTHREQL